MKKLVLFVILSVLSLGVGAETMDGISPDTDYSRLIWEVVKR